MSTFKVAVLEDVKKIAFHDAEKREPGDKQVLVKVDSCAICTLEQRVYTGVMNRYPFAGGHEAAGLRDELADFHRVPGLDHGLGRRADVHGHGHGDHGGNRHTHRRAVHSVFPVGHVYAMQFHIAFLPH